MTFGGAAKQIAETNGLADERLLHEINVPEEAGEQRAESEEHPNTVWTERVAARHGAGDERRPQSHQDAGDDAGDDALLGDGAVYVGEVAVGLPIEHDRDYRAKYAGSKHAGVPFGLQNVAGDHAHDQRDADGNREGNGQAGHINASDEQQVGQIEYGAAGQSGEEICAVRRANVIQEAGGIVSGAAHGEGQDDGDQKNSDGIVPIKQLEAIRFDAL